MYSFVGGVQRCGRFGSFGMQAMAAFELTGWIRSNTSLSGLDKESMSLAMAMVLMMMICDVHNQLAR